MDGRFGTYGGAFVPELLTPALQQLAEAFEVALKDPSYRAELSSLLSHYAGRPTPLYRCRNLVDGAEVFLKREDLVHGGAHKTNQVLGQGLLARRMGKTRLIAETGAGQHGVATAMIGALLSMKVRIYMGAKDVERQRLNVFRMRDWSQSYDTTHYLLGTVAGPHPFPSMVRRLQQIIGEEARAQYLEHTGRLPEAIFACVGGGSNAIGMFTAFIEDKDVQLIGVEPMGRGEEAHGATLQRGSFGILHGARTKVLQDEHGQISPTHSIAAGLDYPGVGPEHAALMDSGRARYIGATDQAALDAFYRLGQSEGIIPALESAHAVAGAIELIKKEGLRHVLINLSGRGDKDVAQVAALEDNV